MPPEGGRLYDMKVKISCACLRYYYESGATIDFIYATQLCLERERVIEPILKLLF